MMPISPDEQRVDFRVPVDILLNKYIKGRPYIARASNVSRRGLLVHRLFEPDNMEQSIGLQFQLPGTERVITCAGRVIYEHRWLPANGVEFTHIAPEHQQLLDDYIMDNLPWP